MKPTPATPPDLRQILFMRIGSASAMVFILLGGLFIFDYLNAPPTVRLEAESSMPQFTEPVPIAKKTPIEPPTPSETLAELPPSNAEKNKPDVTEALGKPNDSQRDSMVQPRQTMPEKKLVDAPTEGRYALQAAVNFTDPRAAEDLRARLLQEEIPSALDIHVQIGPFQTRKESDNAREKLKTLGIEATALPPKGKKQPQNLRKSALAKAQEEIASDPP